MIAADFLEKLENEAPQYVESWATKWALMSSVKGTDYYDSYNGPDELFDWIGAATKTDRLGYFSDSLREDLIKKSRVFDEKVLASIGKKIARNKYDKHIGIWNADDYIFQNVCPVPERMQPKRILDFGPSYGRQINLWHQLKHDLQYVAMEAILKPYMLQNLYYSFVPMMLQEYFDNDDFQIGSDPGLYHLPTWRHDLLPDKHFDMIQAIMVLPELEEPMALFVIELFARIIKPGGALYIRDHGKRIKSANTVNYDSILESSGFVLEFRPHVIDGKDIHGVPRIWRKRVSEIVIP